MVRARVTIGLPAHNAENYLEAAVESILRQTFTDLRVVIADNASTDRTQEIGRRFAQLDPRVSYHRHEMNTGAAANYNFVFERSESELFKWAAHDDVLAPTFLERCVEELDATPRAVLAFPRTRIIDAQDELIREYDDPVPWDGSTPSSRFDSLLGDQLLTHLHMCSPVFGVIRASALRATRLIGAYNGSDAVLLTELALHGDFAQVDEYLFLRRWHDGMSLAGNPSAEAVAVWFDPRRGGRFPMPRTRALIGHAGSVLRAPVPATERVRCAAVLGRWLLNDRQWRVIGGEFRIRVREALHGSHVYQ